MLPRTEETAKRHEAAETRSERPTSRLRAFVASCLSFHRDDTGTAITEAALVMLPLVFFLMIAPAIALIWASEQYARTEAHRDMFDKTTVFVQLPRGDKTGTGDTIAPTDRRRVYPVMPPKIDGLRGNPNSILDAPDEVSLGVGPFTASLFPEGFPNYYAEGWQYQKVTYAGGWWKGEVELMRYGAVARTPWTWLGWPFIASQDAYFEPQQIQSWYDDAKGPGVQIFAPDDTLTKRIRLID